MTITSFVDIRNLHFPGNVAFVSFNVKRLTPKQKLKVIFESQQLEILEKWSRETNNPITLLDRNTLLVERGKGFHGVCLNEKISFYLTGAKLHLKELLLKVSNRYPPFLINFVSIPEGEKAIDKLSEIGLKALILPAPKEIEGYCGFALGTFNQKEAEKLFIKLLGNQIGVEAIFKKTSKGFKKILGSWEV